MHVGETVVGKFEKLNFSGRLVQSYLVQKLFKGLAGGLLILHPLFFDGVVRFLKFRDPFYGAIKLFFQSGYF